MRLIISDELAKEVYRISGQNVYLCYQCGKCSGGCPVISEMDYLPNQVIHMIQIGDETALNVKAIWLCASCFTCTIRCPRGVDLAKVMEALRLIKLRKGIDRINLREIKNLHEYPQIALIAASRKYTG